MHDIEEVDISDYERLTRFGYDLAVEQLCQKFDELLLWFNSKKNKISLEPTPFMEFG